jgi:hypothetical protein
MKTKAVVLLSGGLVALLLISRYFAMSRAGMPLGWLLYLGLPITAAGVLFALRLTSLSSGWSTKAESSALSERLKELGELHARGAISDTEYSAQRLQIISNQ